MPRSTLKKTVVESNDIEGEIKMGIFIDAPFSLRFSNQAFVELAGEPLDSGLKWEEIPHHQAAVCFYTETGTLKVILTPEELEYLRRENAMNQSTRLYLVMREELGKASYTYRMYLENQKNRKGEKKRCRK